MPRVLLTSSLYQTAEMHKDQEHTQTTADQATPRRFITRYAPLIAVESRSSIVPPVLLTSSLYQTAEMHKDQEHTQTTEDQATLRRYIT